jgi:uncharacterized phiE125 gp8 family phage protein
MSIRNTSTSITEPVTVAELQGHGQIDGDDSYLSGLIIAARRIAENEIGRIIPAQEYTWIFNGLENGIELPVYPVASITSITYQDTDGAPQTLASSTYQIVDEGLSQKLYAINGWPDMEDGKYNRVTVVLSAGATTVEADIKQAIMMIALGLYENRNDQIIGTIVSKLDMGSKALLHSYKRFAV